MTLDKPNHEWRCISYQKSVIFQPAMWILHNKNQGYHPVAGLDFFLVSDFDLKKKKESKCFTQKKVQICQ